VLFADTSDHTTTTHNWQWTPRGSLPNFLGCSLDPPPVRKCHQMSSKDHMQLGWVVRWVLSTPPGHPTAGRCGRVVPVRPLLLCTRPARARPSAGDQSPPSRSALAPVGSSLGLALTPCHQIESPNRPTKSTTQGRLAANSGYPGFQIFVVYQTVWLCIPKVGYMRSLYVFQ
jgi:hypothetical protein